MQIEAFRNSHKTRHYFFSSQCSSVPAGAGGSAGDESCQDFPPSLWWFLWEILIGRRKGQGKLRPRQKDQIIEREGRRRETALVRETEEVKVSTTRSIVHQHSFHFLYSSTVLTSGSLISHHIVAMSAAQLLNPKAESRVRLPPLRRHLCELCVLTMRRDEERL